MPLAALPSLSLLTPSSLVTAIVLLLVGEGSHTKLHYTTQYKAMLCSYCTALHWLSCLPLYCMETVLWTARYGNLVDPIEVLLNFTTLHWTRHYFKTQQCSAHHFHHTEVKCTLLHHNIPKNAALQHNALNRTTMCTSLHHAALKCIKCHHT